MGLSLSSGAAGFSAFGSSHIFYQPKTSLMIPESVLQRLLPLIWWQPKQGHMAHAISMLKLSRLGVTSELGNICSHIEPQNCWHKSKQHYIELSGPASGLVYSGGIVCHPQSPPRLSLSSLLHPKTPSPCLHCTLFSPTCSDCTQCQWPQVGIHHWQAIGVLFTSTQKLLLCCSYVELGCQVSHKKQYDTSFQWPVF